jgi:hypothetical protein
LLPPAASLAFVYGMLGGVARRSADVPRLDDLHSFLVPGLAALGIRADLLDLPEDESAVIRLLTARLRRGLLAPVYGLTPRPPSLTARSSLGKGVSEASIAEPSLIPPVSPEEDQTPQLSPFQQEGVLEEKHFAEESGAGQARRGIKSAVKTEAPVSPPSLARYERPGKGDGGLGIVVGIEGQEIRWREAEGEEMRASVAAFCGLFTHALILRRAQRKGQRRANIQAALRRWIAFAAAYPERIPTTGPDDAPVRAYAADFLREIIGKKRDPVANRLRRAAEAFAAADIESALFSLRTAVLLDLHLPALAQRALLSPPSQPLTDVERREMVYLARAGTRDMKALAARRLETERGHSEADSTLEQLGYDPDDWVRAAARSSNAV